MECGKPGDRCPTVAQGIHRRHAQHGYFESSGYVGSKFSSAGALGEETLHANQAAIKNKAAASHWAAAGTQCKVYPFNNHLQSASSWIGPQDMQLLISQACQESTSTL
ncbi:hypothetical protein GOP47_0024922 [Adiantum capillus-veneris]|uniref:Uncharacterized protein n=1 Tax=Adiantum capillus-veneris TaxID=13818 RepID=A0A9D4Z4R9_ADICA|nr:hypothetical protein GOP47_0024922 [Adiantum capillus-veneris]